MSALPPVTIRFAPMARRSLMEVENLYFARGWGDRFRKDLDGALRTIAAWMGDPKDRRRSSIAFQRSSCVLYFEAIAEDTVVVQAVHFMPGNDGWVARLLDSPAAGMPRRFGMGAMLSFTLAFAGLYGVLKYFKVSPVWMVLLVVYFGVLGLGQAILLGGRQPRWASILVGAVFCPAAALALGALGFRTRPSISDSFTGLACLATVIGPITGYLLGGLLAGLFLQQLTQRPYLREDLPDHETSSEPA